MRRNKRVITPVGEIINSELFINWQNDKNEKNATLNPFLVENKDMLKTKNGQFPFLRRK